MVTHDPQVAAHAARILYMQDGESSTGGKTVSFLNTLRTASKASAATYCDGSHHAWHHHRRSLGHRHTRAWQRRKRRRKANFRSLGSDQIQMDTNLELDKGEMQVAGETLSYEDGRISQTPWRWWNEQR